jgi:2-phospho-L-lactate guanylyltransferase
MRTIAVLPIKNFGDAKQRLASALGSGSRQALAQAMFSDVLGSLRHMESLEGVVVVTADRAAEAAAQGARVRVLPDEPRAGQSPATLVGVRYALSAGIERVLLVPGDTPLIDPREIDDLLARAEDERLDAVIVPDRHGSGTNGLLLSPPDALSPSFGRGSRARHEEEARERELRFRVQAVPSLLHDVDTPEDLEELRPVLDERREVAPRTRGALRQLGRAQAVEVLTG